MAPRSSPRKRNTTANAASTITASKVKAGSKNPFPSEPRKTLRCSHIIVALIAIFCGTLIMKGMHLRRRGDGGGVEGPRLGSGKMFDSVANKYDLMNKFMSLGMDMQWRRFLVDAMELKANDHILDLATGTADVAILVGEDLQQKAKGAGEEGEGVTQVLGVDPSAGMLAIGVDKVKDRNLSTLVQLKLGDAQDLWKGEGLALADDAFDKISMSFGIRNVENRLAALQEMYRVIRKKEESIVAILEFSLPSSGPLRYIADFMVRYGAPLIGSLLTGLNDEYTHLKKSILEFPTVEEFVKLMGEAQLEVYDVKETGFGAVTLYLAHPKVPLPAVVEGGGAEEGGAEEGGAAVEGAVGEGGATEL